MLVAGLAQLVEHLICNQRVVGSSPTAGTRISANFRGFFVLAPALHLIDFYFKLWYNTLLDHIIAINPSDYVCSEGKARFCIGRVYWTNG